ncbi:hypothetical protein KEM55_003658, partial [Ascosphaera atra]
SLLPKARDCMRTLVTGIPSQRSKKANAIALGLNIVLSLFTLDFVLRGHLIYSTDRLAFSRIGYVSDSSASILIREPNPAKFPLYLRYREATDAATGKAIEAKIVYSVTNDTDYTAPVTIDGLRPSTRYNYTFSNGKTGEFTTSPSVGSEEAKSLSFITSSCIKPNFPYNPFAHPFRIKGLELISTVLGDLPQSWRPQFMLFLGDFIYIDVPTRLGSSIDTYRREYRKVYSSPSWKFGPAPARNIPWIHTLDEHEFENDWSLGNATAPYPAAADPYLHYHVSVNPPIPEPNFGSPANTTYTSFTNGPVSFFILDTRTYRTPPMQRDSTMLGSAQLKTLLHFISREEPSGVKWKIIASSVPFTKNWHVGTQDTWGGFLHERQIIFEAIWKAERELGIRVVLLSGDRHEFAAIRFPDPSQPSQETNRKGVGEGVHEFSVGPLSMFYLPARSYGQTGDSDVTIKYVPDGNYKWGAIRIDYEAGTETSVLTYDLYVDGKVQWSYQLTAPEHGGTVEGRGSAKVLYDGVKDAMEWPFWKRK